MSEIEDKAYAAADELIEEIASADWRDMLALAYLKGSRDGLEEGRDIAVTAFANLAKELR